MAAKQRRFVLLIGEPGTGKSMLGAAMSELLKSTHLEDILVCPNPENRLLPLIKRVESGEAKKIIEESKVNRKRSQLSINYFFWVGVVATLAMGIFYWIKNDQILYLFGAVFFSIVWLFTKRFFRPESVVEIPKILVENKDRTTAPFVDATGFHSGALLGDVRHDPYQSGGAETPPHELIEAGAIHKAHNGVLFIDEASALREDSQHNLLTVIQEKKMPITGRSLGSSGAMVRTEPVPCDFVLVLAGNKEDVNQIHPALRSRIRGYGYEIFTSNQMEDNEVNRMKIARFITQEIRKDGKIPDFTFEAVEQVILEGKRRSGKANQISLRLRELGGLVRAAGDVAVSVGGSLVTPDHVIKAKELANLFQSQMVGQLVANGSVPFNSSSKNSTKGRILFPSMIQQNKYFPVPLLVYSRKIRSDEKPKLVTRFLDSQDREYIYDLVKTVVLERFGIDISDSIIFAECPSPLYMTPVDDLILPITLGIYSHLSDKPIPHDLVAIGNLRCDGTIGPVDFLGMKLDDVISYGMKTILIPEANKADLPAELSGKKRNESKIISFENIEKFPDLF